MNEDLTFTIDNCELNQAVLETLIDEVNVMITTIVKMRAGIPTDNEIFVTPFQDTLGTWAKEETDKERLLSDDDIKEMYETVLKIAKRFFDELTDSDNWFCFTYRLKVSVVVPSLREKYTLLKLSRASELVRGVDEETIDEMYMTAKRVLRIVF